MNPVTFRSRCLNPCDDFFWKTRGYSCRPYNWKDILEREGYWDSYDEEQSEYESDFDDNEDYDEYAWQKKCQNDLRSRQNNPCDVLYWKVRGYADRPSNWRELVYGSQEEYYSDESESEYYDNSEYDEEAWRRKLQNDLRSRQMNPCDELYWQSRGYAGRPSNWRQLVYN